MKKINIFSLATLMVLVCTGLLSCSSDNDDKVEEGAHPDFSVADLHRPFMTA